MSNVFFCVWQSSNRHYLQTRTINSFLKIDLCDTTTYLEEICNWDKLGVHDGVDGIIRNLQLAGDHYLGFRSDCVPNHFA